MNQSPGTRLSWSRSSGRTSAELSPPVGERSAIQSGTVQCARQLSCALRQRLSVPDLARPVVSSAPGLRSHGPVTWSGAVRAVKIPMFGLVLQEPPNRPAAHIAFGGYLHPSSLI